MSGNLAIKQAPRLLKIESPLGADVLILRRLRVSESIFAPFRMEGEVISARDNLTATDLVDKLVTCTIQQKEGPPRHFHGYVRSFGRSGAFARGLTIYQFEAVPKMWNLTRTADCRIFQRESVKDITEKLLTEGKVDDFSWNCSGEMKPRDYIVQYNETDWEFLHRLWAEVGVGYCHTHEVGKHTALFCSAASDWPTIPNIELVVHPAEIRQDVLSTWQPKGAVQVGKVVSIDTDLLKFSATATKEASTLLPQSNAGTWEVYLAPGGQAAQEDADPAKLMMEAAEAEAELYASTGREPSLFAGGKVRIKQSMDATSADTFLITEILHEAYDETQLNANGTDDYRNSFTVMPADRPWRPKRTRGRPVMPGLQRAVVTGPSGEEIHVDENGRIKVQFLWDRYGQKNEDSSCWVRVMQPLAGSWGGTWFLPRVGDEVLVAFIDGDADRPIVVGSLYNYEAKPVVHKMTTNTPGKSDKPLNTHNTRTGIRTRSSKGGGGNDFNMIMLDDKRGEELFDVQAQKDLTILVKNDRTEEIRNDRKETIDGKHTETVKLDYSTTVTQGNQKLIVNKGNIDTKADMGNIAIKASLGAITIEAMQSITLKVGQSTMTIDNTGIKLEGMMIEAKAQLNMTTEGAFATHKAAGIMTIKGGVVMIN